MGRPLWTRFRRQEKGAVAVPFALSLLGMLFFIGMAVDVGTAFSAKSKLDAITDSASLAGASSARLELLSSGLGSTGKTNAVLEAARETAYHFFSSQMAEFPNVAAAADISVALANGNITSTVTYKATYIPMPDDWGYMATLGQPSQIGGPGTRADDVPRVLKACAGDLYFEATSSDQIATGFVNILRSASAPRLVM